LGFFEVPFIESSGRSVNDELLRQSVNILLADTRPPVPWYNIGLSANTLLKCHGSSHQLQVLAYGYECGDSLPRSRIRVARDWSRFRTKLLQQKWQDYLLRRQWQLLSALMDGIEAVVATNFIGDESLHAQNLKAAVGIRANSPKADL
jgi:hypothetical protein